MQTYEECVKHYQTYCGMEDPSIVISFLLKEIRCRDKRIDDLEESCSLTEKELTDLIESEGL